MDNLTAEKNKNNDISTYSSIFATISSWQYFERTASPYDVLTMVIDTIDIE